MKKTISFLVNDKLLLPKIDNLLYCYILQICHHHKNCSDLNN